MQMANGKMETFFKEPTSVTPFVLLDAENRLCEIAGRSIPIDADEFYKPILDWFNALAHQNLVDLTVQIKLEFLNIASSKRLLTLFAHLGQMAEYGTKVTVHWYYSEEDSEMLEVGKDYASLVSGLQFAYRTFKPAKVVHKPKLEGTARTRRP